MLINKNSPKRNSALEEVDDDDVVDIEKRKIYVKPKLEEMGDLRTLTLGVTQGVNESGPFTPNHW